MPKILKQFIKKAIHLKPLCQKSLEKLKRDFARSYKVKIFPNRSILRIYRQLVKEKVIPKNQNLENLLKTQKTRTLSGIAALAVFTKPYPCPGKCIYCPSELKMPKSYLKNEPAVMRAILCKYSPEKQIRTRLDALEQNGHPTDKIELIVMGGTFSVLPKSYQLRFITRCFQACNRAKRNVKCKMPNVRAINKNLEVLKIEQRKNEKAKQKIIGLTLETRPDQIDKNEIKWMRKLGATRVELGVQSIYDDVLIANKRGHLVQKTIEAIKLLKDAGFKINCHIMPNLFKSDEKRDYAMFSELFSNPDFQPDMLKIYPCVLTKNSELYKFWKQGDWQPYDDQKLIKLLIKIKQIIPPYVRIMRLGRDIPAPNIVAGNKISNIRQEIHTLMAKKDIDCQCIRCREIKNANYKTQNAKLVRREYDASRGKEIFLSYEDKSNNKLLAFLRLRIPSQYFSGQDHFIPVLQNAGLIREIHTYGQLVPVHKKDKSKVQHTGFGKKLVLEAEKIVKQEYKLPKLAVISGVGVRDYWRKLRYRLSDTYMIKNLA